MRFYIASRTAKIKEVKEIYNQIREKGYEISYDWTKIPNIGRPFDQIPEITKGHVKKIIKGIRDSDVFIMISDKEGTDMYGELASAISFNSMNKKPKVFVLGSNLSPSVFPFHPSVKIKRSIEEILEEFSL